MQICKADVSLNGDRNAVVADKVATVAEILLLRHIHGGEQSVTNIRPIEQDKRTVAFEVARLKTVYRSKRALIDELFGKIPRLPINLEDIGVEHPVVEDARAQSGKKPAPKKAAAKKPAAKKSAANTGDDNTGGGAGDGTEGETGDDTGDESGQNPVPSPADMAGQGGA